MNKKTQKKYVALLTLLAMVVCTMFCTNTVKADTDLPWDESEVAKTSTCVINGVERTLTLLKEGDSYIQIGNSEPILISFNMPEVGFDQYGSVWGVYYLDTAICWWNYDLSPDDMTLHNINRPTAENPNAYVNDVESLIFDENDQFVVPLPQAAPRPCPLPTTGSSTTHRRRPARRTMWKFPDRTARSGGSAQAMPRQYPEGSRRSGWRLGQSPARTARPRTSRPGRTKPRP